MLPSKLSEWLKDLDPGTNPQYKGAQMAMVKTCVFAHHILASEFGHTVKDALINVFIKRITPCYEVIAYANANLPDESMILKPIVDCHCAYYMPTTRSITTTERFIIEISFLKDFYQCDGEVCRALRGRSRRQSGSV